MKKAMDGAADHFSRAGLGKESKEMKRQAIDSLFWNPRGAWTFGLSRLDSPQLLVFTLVTSSKCFWNPSGKGHSPEREGRSRSYTVAAFREADE